MAVKNILHLKQTIFVLIEPLGAWVFYKPHQITDFHLISWTFHPFGIFDSPGPYIQAEYDLAQAAVQKVSMSSSTTSVPFILYTTPGSIVLNWRVALL
jgi:hypothetical protein